MNGRSALLLATALGLAACSDSGFDENSQIGPNPALPEPQQYLLPPIKVAAGVGWKAGEAPVAAAGLKVQALATGLLHPRFVYVLPNGDILAVQAKSPPAEPVKRPKDPIVGLVKNEATSYPGSPKAASRITLIRDADGDGKPELQVTLLDKLKSPFGVVYVDGNLYVANTDGVMRYAFTPGQTSITAPGQMLTPLPGGPIDHHWTKSLTVSPDGSKLYATVGSNSNIVENGFEAEKGRRQRLGDRPQDRCGARVRHRPAQPQQPELLPRHQRPVGGRQRARRAWPAPRPGLPHLGSRTAASTAGRTAITAGISTRACSRSVQTWSRAQSPPTMRWAAMSPRSG